MMKAEDQSAVWRKHSSQWQKVGAPLRPTQQDGELMLAAIEADLAKRQDGANVVILGVTPELVQLPWPPHVILQAFDHSAEMIAAVWRAHPEVSSSVRQASWQRLPLPDRSIRIAVGDGALNVLPHLSNYPDVLFELKRVLAPDGLLCLRCFIRPDEQESIEAVAAAALAGEIQSFHALKWRVAMTLSRSPEFSVMVTDIHAIFELNFPDRLRLAQATGWPLEVINTIDAYRGMQTRYTFPTLDALKEASTPFFSIEKVAYGNYELAERCPTVSLRLNTEHRGDGS